MGYIEYCIIYENGEAWSETKPFYDNEDYIRLSDPVYCTALAEQYKAKEICVVGVRLYDRYYEGGDIIGTSA